jgi:hypothetical protein
VAPLAATATATRLGDAVSALADAAAALRPIGPWGGVLVTAAGIAALTVGARHARVVAAWGGAEAGALAVLALHRPIEAHLGLSPAVAVCVGGAAVGVACGAFPAGFPFAAGALIGAFLGGEIVVDLIGVVAGALVGGLAGVALGRLITAAFASFTGGVLAALGLATAFAWVSLAREMAARPFALAGMALVLGIAGTAYQAGRPPPPPQQPPPPPTVQREPEEWPWKGSTR